MRENCVWIWMGQDFEDYHLINWLGFGEEIL
jgi:hypothetical protein